MTTLNVIVINLHTWLTANLYHLAFQLIIWFILRNIAEFHIVPSTILLRHGLDFSKSITRFSNLLLITLTTASSLLICWFAVANLVIVSNNFEIWSQRFQRSESTITFPLRLIISWTRSAFFSALIALSDKLNRLVDMLFPTIMLLNERIDKSTMGRVTAKELIYLHSIYDLSWLYVLVMSRTCFRMNLHSIVAWMSRNS